MLKESMCTRRDCQHYQGVSSPANEKDQKNICAAYLKGIPSVIAYGGNKHLTVRNDQENEIVFEKGKNIFER